MNASEYLYIGLIAILFVVIIGGCAYSIVEQVKDKKRFSQMSPDKQTDELQRRTRLSEENNRIFMENLKKAQLANAEKQKREAVIAHYGAINPAMMCPHCQTKGKVRTKHVTQKKGISGGKATAAVLTGGVSLLAVGLSRKEGATQAHCDNCKNTWLF